MTSEYFVKIDQFEGPLDLLLYLIRVHEIDIFKIDIFKLTTQYLNYLRVAEFDDLTDASAFIEMAATLIELKTRQMLPHHQPEKLIGEDGEEDPARSLQERLLEYDRFRKAAEFFEYSPQMGVQIQTNQEWLRLAPDFEHVEAPLRSETASLVVMYEQLLKAMVERKPGKVEAKMHRITVEETIDLLCQYMDQVQFILFQGMYNKFKTRYDFVVHILAILELCKSGLLNTYQDKLTGPLWVYLRSSELEKLPFYQANQTNLATSN
ncbi:MAG: segregation/condensation protein A [Oligoflexales bacterium]|nr:segregation/condensation protein A [Oligoflexales bacterium]